MGGIRTKSETIRTRSAHSDFDIIIFVETWLNDNFFDEEYFDSNLYNVFRKDRNVERTGCSLGGGVLIAVHRKLKAFHISLLNEDPILDQLCVCVKGSSRYGSLFLLVSYIPPNSNYDLYKSHTDNIVSLVLNKVDDSHICVFGDFNFPNVVWSSNFCKHGLLPTNVTSSLESYVIDNLLGLDLVQINSFGNKLNRTLDLIFVSANINSSISDCFSSFSPADKHHVPLLLNVEFYEFTGSKQDETLYFNFSCCDFSRLNCILLDINWEDLLSGLDVVECYSAFKAKLHEIFMIYVPQIKKRPFKLPWYTNQLNKLKNKRNKLHKKFLESKNQTILLNYQQCSKKFNCLNNFLYRNYILRIEENIKSNPKAFWRFVKSKKSSAGVPSAVHFNGKSATTPADAANLFADFFKSNFSQDDPDLFSSCHINLPSSLSFGDLKLVSRDIENGISSLKTSTQTDKDGLSAIFLKNCRAIIIPLKFIFNKSLSSGVFVNDWKITTITPIFKSGKKNDVCNYRPISKLSIISKLFEGIVKDKVYFATKSLISPNQHGFVKCRSTVSNLAAFGEFCFSTFAEGFQVDCVYTDFSKAFDRVSHAILLHKLASLGFHSIFYQWLKSYLSDRRCVVMIEGECSVPFIASSGVPQGSILGPLLFVLFINDISNCFSFANFLLYADDLKIFSAIRKTEDILMLQADINALVRWCGNSGISLNIKKCFHVTFAKTQNILQSSYNIADTLLQPLHEFKDLGVIFDSQFSFNSHINFVVSSSYSILSFIRRNSLKFSDPYTLKLLFTSFVRSRLEYATFIWRPCHQFAIERLERVQKVFLKFALRSLKYSHPIPSYNSRLMLINLKSLENRRSILSLSFVFSLIKGDIDCSSLLSNIPFHIPTRSLRITYPFHLKLLNTNYARNAPLARALREFNEISSSIPLDFSMSKNELHEFLNSFF